MKAQDGGGDNQEDAHRTMAAVLEVSGSPDENFAIDFHAPDKTDHRADGVDEFRAGVKIRTHHEVASLMPAMPFPCANAEAVAATRSAAERMIFLV